MLTVFKYIFLLFFIECRRNKPVGVYIALTELVSLNILCLCTNLVQLGNAVALEILFRSNLVALGIYVLDFTGFKTPRSSRENPRLASYTPLFRITIFAVVSLS